MMLDDLEFQWKRGRLPNMLSAMELVMLAVLNADSPVKVWTSLIENMKNDGVGSVFISLFNPTWLAVSLCVCVCV